jgi:hypothetical protein
MLDELDRTMQLFGFVGIGFFIFLACSNALFVVRNLIKHDRHVSLIPLIGGLSGFFGCLAIPSMRYFAIAPLLLDVGTASFLFFGLPLILKEVWLTCRWNLLREYVGQVERKRVQLRLFRHGVFILSQEFERKPGEVGIVKMSTIGKWSETDDELRLRQNGMEAAYRADAVRPSVLHQVVGFHSWEENDDLTLEEVDLQLKYPSSEE